MYITEIDGRPVKHLGTIIEKRTDNIDCPIYDEDKRTAVINDYQFLDNGKKVRYIYETLKPERWE